MAAVAATSKQMPSNLLRSAPVFSSLQPLAHFGWQAHFSSPVLRVYQNIIAIQLGFIEQAIFFQNRHDSVYFHIQFQLVIFLGSEHQLRHFRVHAAVLAGVRKISKLKEVTLCLLLLHATERDMFVLW